MLTKDFMLLDRMKWKKRIHVSDFEQALTSLLRIHSEPQHYGTKAQLLLLCIYEVMYVFAVS